MNKTLRKTIVYNETLAENGTSIAILRGTINASQVGQYSINCNVVDKEAYETNREEIQIEEDAFTEMVRSESNADNSFNVVSETAAASTNLADKKSAKSIKK